MIKNAFLTDSMMARSKAVACAGVLVVFLFGIGFSGSIAAQGVNDGYAPQISGDSVRAIAVQPDGKAVIAGFFSTVGGQGCESVCRLSVDGQRDPTFTNPVVSGQVLALALMPDGKIVIGGSFTTVNNQPRPNLARLNANGSLDFGFNFEVNQLVQSLLLQPDGKLLVGGRFTQLGGHPRQRLARINPDGGLDLFELESSSAGAEIRAMSLQSDGKLLIAGLFSSINGVQRNSLARLQPDGSLDQDYAPNPAGAVNALLLQDDGHLVLGGGFSSIAGQSISFLARVRSDGVVDANFDPNPNNGVLALQQRPDGRVLVGGGFGSIGGHTIGRLAQLNRDGLVDASFNPNPNSFVQALAIQQDGKPLLGGSFLSVDGEPRARLARLNLDGSLDRNLVGFGDGVPGFFRVDGLLEEPEGRLLVSGQASKTFTAFRQRWNADGTVGPVFAPVLSAGDDDQTSIRSVLVQHDGKIVMAGNFGLVNGVARRGLVRLHPDGSVDTDFDAGTVQSIFAMAQQADGRLFIAGFFTTVGGIEQRFLARLNTDGSLDPSFTAEPDGAILGLIVQPDGELVVSGLFSSINGLSRFKLARLHPDGSIDTSFQSPLTATASISATAQQADGRLLIAGQLFGAGGIQHQLVRLGLDGSIVGDYLVQFAGEVRVLSVDIEDAVMVGGGFSTVNGVVSQALVRVLANGIVDPNYGAVLQPDCCSVDNVIIQNDGKILFSGPFVSVAGVQRIDIGRVSFPPAAVQSLHFSAGTATWLRSGAGPQILLAPTLSISVDGENFVTLGPMTAIAGGWQFNGIQAPVETPFLLRARAAVPVRSRSQGQVESVVQAWLGDRIFRSGFELD